MRLLLLVNGFPSNQYPAKGIFNLRAAHQLSALCDLKIVTFRTWIPGRPFRTKYKFDGLDVVCIFLPTIPYIKNLFFLKINLLIRRFIGYLFLPTDYKRNIEIVHSIQLTENGPVSSAWAKKLNSYSVVQCIGSDVNYDLEKYNSKSFLKLLGHVDGIICNSIDLLKKVTLIFPENICKKVIYRGIDFSIIKKGVNEAKGISFKFLFLGGFWTHPRNKKGELTLLEAIEIYQSKNHDKNTEFLIGGQNSISEHLEEWRKNLRYPEKVKMIGELKPEKVYKTIDASNVLIIPSPAEGLPNVLLESSALGTASIASDVGGIPEVIDHNENGILIKPANVDSLVEAIAWCVGNKSQVDRFGSRIKEKVKKEFNGSNYAERLMDFYNEIVRRNNY